MGRIQEWDTTYPTSGQDTATNFPTLEDHVDDTLASHFNELATAVKALELGPLCVLVTGAQPAADVAIGAGDTLFLASTSFTIQVAGVYLVEFTGPFFSITTPTTIQVKLVFDEGGGGEQYIGYDTTWQSRIAADASGGTYSYPRFRAKATLSAGSHTVKGYAKEMAGTTASVIGTGTVAVGDASITLLKVYA